PRRHARAARPHRLRHAGGHALSTPEPHAARRPARLRVAGIRRRPAAEVPPPGGARARPREEAGYAALLAYLDRAGAALAGNPDRAEILADLEQAIAERCDRL